MTVSIEAKNAVFTGVSVKKSTDYLPIEQDQIIEIADKEIFLIRQGVLTVYKQDGSTETLSIDNVVYRKDDVTYYKTKTYCELEQLSIERLLMIQDNKKNNNKKHHALSILSTHLLFIMALYTFTLIALTTFVERMGVSTYIDIALLLCFAIVTYNILYKSGFPLRSFGLTFQNWRNHLIDSFILTIPVLVFFFMLKWALITMLPQFSHIPLFNLTATFIEVGFTYKGFFLAIIIYIIFAVIQEFIARVGLQSSFSKFLPDTKWKTGKVILLSNLLFAMAHTHIGPLFALAVFLPGLYWGWMFARQQSLIGVSFSHMITGIWVLFILGFTQFIQ